MIPMLIPGVKETVTRRFGLELQVMKYRYPAAVITCNTSQELSNICNLLINLLIKYIYELIHGRT